MEKISALIDKLQELKTTGATLQSISYYVQLLQAEILHARSLERERERELQRRQTNIAVIMPGAIAEPAIPASSNGHITATQVTPSQPIPAVEYTPEPPLSTPAPVQEFIPEPSQPAPVQEFISTPPAPIQEHTQDHTSEPLILPASLVTPPLFAEPKPAPVEPPAPPKEEKPTFLTLFGNAEEAVVNAPKPEPVPAHKAEIPVQPAPAPVQEFIPATPQPAAESAPAPKAELNGITKELKELNQKVAQNIPSLNDRLRQQYTEVADRFSDMPVRDLRQAIGINDKFQFIQELFRGDVDSYERSLKTINEMDSLQDAEYWIERELKIRQGWVDDNRAVRQFYTLVKKRFS